MFICCCAIVAPRHRCFRRMYVWNDEPCCSANLGCFLEVWISEREIGDPDDAAAVVVSMLVSNGTTTEWIRVKDLR